MAVISLEALYQKLGFAEVCRAKCCRKSKMPYSNGTHHDMCSSLALIADLAALAIQLHRLGKSILREKVIPYPTV